MKKFKIVLIIIAVIIIICFINAIRNNSIFSNIENIGKQYSMSQNYSVLINSYDSNGNINMTTKYYKKDKKELTIIEKTTPKVKIMAYNDGTKIDIFTENENLKKVSLNQESNPIQINNPESMNLGNNKFLISLLSFIKNENFNNKKCYKVVSLLNIGGFKEILAEKETGLIVKENNNNKISDKYYEFNNVDENVFIEPDISNYEVTSK